MMAVRASWLARPRPVAGVILVAVIATACAERAIPATTSTTPAPNGKVVQITPASSGRTITVHVGDTLRLQLGPPIGESIASWELRAYPRRILTLTANLPKLNRLDLLATSPGRGDVVVVSQVRCGPGPAPAAAGVQCPVLAGGGPQPTGSPGGSGAMPARQFSFTIVVTR